MNICLVCEASYPYAKGGVSSWVQMLLRAMPDVEFQLLTIVVDRTQGGKFNYELPDNLTKVTELYLNDSDYLRSAKFKTRLTGQDRDALYSFIMGKDIQWEGLFELINGKSVSLNGLLMGRDFLDIVTEFYKENYYRLPYTDFLWTYRSMMLPLCTLLKNKMPKADIYHSVSTGYAGMLASMSKQIYDKPVIISEHGIYTREREEDIIRASFIEGPYKNMWISHFYKLSDCAYTYGDKIVSLFEDARSLQIEIGCPGEKTLVVPNGFPPTRFDSCPVKEDHSVINLGIVARVTPIKDIKTLINSFAAAKDEVKNLVLYIMGPHDGDDTEYYEECLDLVSTLGLKDVHFTGNVDVNEYMLKMDMIILTSISEGQPISILEAMSARRPCISTKVGNCAELLLGRLETDEPCGIITNIMNVEQISNAIIDLAKDEDKRRRYGDVARTRVEERYRLDMVIERYRAMYDELAGGAGA